MQMSNLIGAAGLILVGVAGSPAEAMEDAVAAARFEADGSVVRPSDYREWVLVGTTLTPNALNGGAAAFPEYHHIYVEPSAYAHYVRTGEWADGTQIAKELLSVATREGADATGASPSIAGVGYFQGDFNGLGFAIKDTKRYADAPGGWAYFTFGFGTSDYAETAAAQPVEACNTCHEVNAADTDFVFAEFYPILQAAHTPSR